jgi:chromosome segregation ATPase/DNA-directed RNA polymerase subunit M/transcription elongation factor TFIIS
MSQRFPIPCPNCGSELLIRVQNLGRKGKCNHCGHLFRAQMKDVSELKQFLDARPVRDAKGEHGRRAVPGGGSPKGSRTNRGQSIGERASEQAGHARRPEEKESRPAPLQDGEPEGWQTSPTALSPNNPLAHALGQEWEAARSLLQQLRTEVAELRDRAARADRLEQEQRAERAEIEDLRAKLHEARDRARSLDEEGAGARAGEIEALREECERLREEAQAVRSRLETQSAEDGERLNRLSEECDAVRADLEHAEVAREVLARELKQARDREGAEHEALIREVEQLQNALERWEHLRDQAVLEHDEDCARWEAERRELEASRVSLRTELLDAARRLADQANRFEAEQRAWDQQRIEHARMIAERDQQISHVEQLQVQTGLERDALARERTQLRDQLEALERGRVEAEAEFDASRARWDAERHELRAQGERERRELQAEADRRLDEQEARMEAERRAWDQQLDEHDQLAAEWESLAREVDRVQASLIDDREALKLQVARLRDQLETLARSRDEAGAEFQAARDRWEAERHEVQDQWAEEVQNLNEARRQVEREHRDAYDRLVAERDALERGLEHSRDQIEELKRSQAEREAESSESRRRAEDERREREARWERKCQDLVEEMERRLTEQRQEFADERQGWQKQVVTDRAAESAKEEIEGLQAQLDATRDERDAAHRQVEAMSQERDRLGARIVEAEAARRVEERSRQAERDQLVVALEQARRESESASQHRREQSEEIRRLRAELDRQRKRREALGAEKQRSLATLRRDWEIERQRWLELLNAAHPSDVPDRPGPSTDLPTFPPGDTVERSTTGTAPKPGRGRTSLRPRPQASSYRDPERFRDDLEQWVAAARATLQGLVANAGRSGSPAFPDWLEYEIRTAREEMAFAFQEPPPGPTDPAEGSAVPTIPT